MSLSRWLSSCWPTRSEGSLLVQRGEPFTLDFGPTHPDFTLCISCTALSDLIHRDDTSNIPHAQIAQNPRSNQGVVRRPLMFDAPCRIMQPAGTPRIRQSCRIPTPSQAGKSPWFVPRPNSRSQSVRMPRASGALRRNTRPLLHPKGSCHQRPNYAR